VAIWTKICGITRVEDALAAAQAGADAIGVNFCPTSPRYCDPAAASAIVDSIEGSVASYGVFAGASPDSIAEIVARVRLTGVQLHGGEDVAFVARVRSVLGPGVEIVRVIAVTSRSVVVAALRTHGHRLLLDNARGGGSGACFDARQVAGLDLSDVIVAGGLDPANVSSAIAQLRPYGVDTASGIESAPGIKDHAKLREFIENAKRSAA
jgi:phosphoribosylanthranilate isomerase